jgi:hypothetical protein
MKSCILVGGGASVKEGIELGLWDKLAERKDWSEIWSINFAFMAMPYRPAKQIWVDTTFFRNNTEALQELNRNGVECITKKHDIYNYIPEIKQYKTTRDEFNVDIDKPLFIGRMGLSGTFALSLSVALKYETIYLLGYDFGTNAIANQNTHFYQDTISVRSAGVRNPGVYLQNNNVVKKEVKEFEHYKNTTSKIYNVSLVSNISAFEKLSYQDFFSKISS